MPIKTDLLDLPRELLVRICELYFEDIKVKLTYLSQCRFNGCQKYASLMLTCKTLNEIAEMSFFENVEIDVKATEMVHFKSRLRDCPFAEGVKHPAVLRYADEDEHILYPVQLFRHLKLDRYAFNYFLSGRHAEQRRSIRAAFPHADFLRAECTISLQHWDRSTLILPTSLGY